MQFSVGFYCCFMGSYDIIQCICKIINKLKQNKAQKKIESATTVTSTFILYPNNTFMFTLWKGKPRYPLCVCFFSLFSLQLIDLIHKNRSGQGAVSTKGKIGIIKFPFKSHTSISHTFIKHNREKGF